MLSSVMGTMLPDATGYAQEVVEGLHAQVCHMQWQWILLACQT